MSRLSGRSSRPTGARVSRSSIARSRTWVAVNTLSHLVSIVVHEADRLVHVTPFHVANDRLAWVAGTDDEDPPPSFRRRQLRPEPSRQPDAADHAHQEERVDDGDRSRVV